MVQEPGSVKEWTKIFKGLGNGNRLKIIQFLYPTEVLTVTEIKEKLGISYKWTSRNLVDLEKIGILESEGKRGHILYRIYPNLSQKIRKAIETFL